MDNKSHLTRVGLGVLIMALLLALAFFLLNILYAIDAPTSAAVRGRQSLWQAKDSQMTLEQSAQRADARAKSWAEDVVLIRAEAPWRPGAAGLQTETPPVTWSFFYYSPATRELAGVVVGREQLYWVPPLELSYMPKSIPALPPFGVDVAWLSFRAAGGEEFLRVHPEAMVDFRLRPHESGNIVWSVAAFDGQDYLEVLIDANSGAVLP
ncbi:MAG: hypothetical protein JXR84_15460 [Anaerolineae bacterium]|nr:hypothetical protein [Anaerolineae bacterium]